MHYEQQHLEKMPPKKIQKDLAAHAEYAKTLLQMHPDPLAHPEQMLAALTEKRFDDLFAWWSLGVFAKENTPLQSLVRLRECPHVLFFYHHYGAPLDAQGGALLFHSAMTQKEKNVQMLLDLAPNGNWSRAAYLGVLNLCARHRWNPKAWGIAKLLVPYVQPQDEKNIFIVAQKIPSTDGSFERLEQLFLDHACSKSAQSLTPKRRL